MAAAIQNQNADVLSKMDVGKSNGLMEMSAGSGAYTAKMEKISAMSEIHNDIGPRLVDSSGLLKAAELDNRMKASLKAQGDKVLGQINIYQVSKYRESFVKLNKVLMCMFDLDDMQIHNFIDFVQITTKFSLFLFKAQKVSKPTAKSHS